MRLIATWTSDQNPATEMPRSLKWDNGTPATMDDYRAHSLDTHSLHASGDGGMECHMFPDLVAEVVYDWFANDWVVKGRGVVTAALELHNPNATNEQITAELFTFPIVYRAKIVRSPVLVN